MNTALATTRNLLVTAFALFAAGCVTLKNHTEPSTPVVDIYEYNIVSDHEYSSFDQSLVKRIRRYMVDNPGHHFLLSTKPQLASNVKAYININGQEKNMQVLISSADAGNATGKTLWVDTEPFSSFCVSEISYYYRVSYLPMLGGLTSTYLGSQGSPLKTNARAYGGILMYSVGDVSPPPDRWQESMSGWTVEPFKPGKVSYGGKYHFADIPDGASGINLIPSEQLFEREFHLVNLTQKQYTVLSIIGNTVAPTVIVPLENGMDQTVPNRGANFAVTSVSALPATLSCGASTVFKVRYTRAAINSYSAEFARLDIALREDGLPSGVYNARNMFFIVTGYIPVNPP